MTTQIKEFGSSQDLNTFLATLPDAKVMDIFVEITQWQNQEVEHWIVKYKL